jgi:hypothetical protein
VLNNNLIHFDRRLYPRLPHINRKRKPAAFKNSTKFAIIIFLLAARML